MLTVFPRTPSPANMEIAYVLELIQVFLKLRTYETPDSGLRKSGTVFVVQRLCECIYWCIKDTLGTFSQANPRNMTAIKHVCV